MSAPRLWNLVAELTYRCPLRCVYCSNPIGYASVDDALDADTWGRVFEEAAALGAVHVGLTGGEPAARRDLEQIVRRAVEADLYTHLVTSGLALGSGRLRALARAGLRSVQLSIQDVEAAAADEIAGARAHASKLAFAAEVRALGLPLALNVVLHRSNLDRVEEMIVLAMELGAHRLELANAQYHGWALRNRDALLPDVEQLRRASRAVEAARERRGAPELVLVLPDYFSDRPKPCMGGWGERIAVVNPAGRVLPCHAAGELPLVFWNVREHPLAECWRDAPGMNAYRGEGWMREPCRSCPERTRDRGGCRCQAHALLGDAARTDPACALSPDRAHIVEARARAGPKPWVHREARDG